MGILSWINLIDRPETVLTSGQSWTGSLNELKKPLMSGFIRSNTIINTILIDIDLGESFDVGVIALLGANYSSIFSAYVRGGDAPGVFGFQGQTYGVVSGLQPYRFISPIYESNTHNPPYGLANVRHRYWQIELALFEGMYVDLRRLWLGPALPVKIQSPFSMNPIDQSEVVITKSNVASIEKKRIVRELRCNASMSHLSAFGYGESIAEQQLMQLPGDPNLPNRINMQECYLTAGTSSEVVLIPHADYGTVSFPIDEEATKIYRHAVYGLLQGLQPLDRAASGGNTGFSVRELPG